MEDGRKVIAVVDGNSLMHRAYHAISPSMNAPDGRPTNAIFGFVSMFVKMVETFHPDGVIVCFDKGKPKVRMEMLPQYKAQRPPMDDALHVQFPMIKDLLRAMDVPVVELEGWEGDDLLGTIARRGEHAGYLMYLVTGDRDMYQLSTDSVRIVSTRKGLSDVAIMTPESVNDLYNGITPELVPDFYGLKGDSSDNIPGVPGIGPKKAAALISQYGSLDEVIAHADEVKGKMGENLRAHIDDALLSRKVATIRTDAPIELDLASAAFPTWDLMTVKAAFDSLGFTRLVGNVLSLGGDSADAVSVAPVNPYEVGALLEGDEALEALATAIAAGEWVGAAVGGQDAQASLFAATTDLWCCFDPAVIEEAAAANAGATANDSDAANPDPANPDAADPAPTGPLTLLHLQDAQAEQAVAQLLREGFVSAADVKALAYVACPPDSSQPALVEPQELDPARIFDVSVAGYLLDSGTGSYEAAQLAERYLTRSLPADESLAQAARDAIACHELAAPLALALSQDGSASCYVQIEMPLVGVLLAMERRGMAVDPAELARQSAELAGEMDELTERIYEQAGERFNVNSPAQLSHVLFDVLQLPTRGLKKTSRGNYSTNAKVLEGFAATVPLVADVLAYREKAKIRGTYLDALPALIAGDGRIHTTLNQTVAATGRLSSSDPNLQNIPVRSSLGRRVREAFRVPEGSLFLSCDYSQIELRLLAHLSGDEGLVAAFCGGEDFHAETAARTFGVPLADVTPELRSRAKAVNFGIVYGQQAYGLSQSLKIPMGEAQEMIDRYFEAYPGVRAYLDAVVQFARENGWVDTMYGRKRHVPDIGSRNHQLRSFAERTAMNHPMQGSAADIIKIAMAQVEARLAAEGLQARVVMQIHDELDLELPASELEVVSAVVRETMESVVQLRVPLVADVAYGGTWAEAK